MEALEGEMTRPSSPFLGGSDGKESACNVGDPVLIPGLGRSPRGRAWQPLVYFFLETPHGLRSLAGYSAWGHKELDTTERLNTSSCNWQVTKREQNHTIS